MLQSVVSAIRNTVPISQFNRGLAGKIFADVKTTGPKGSSPTSGVLINCKCNGEF